MIRPQSAALRARSFAFVLSAVALAASAGAQSRTYTLDADFDEGVLANVNHTAVHDQLQLDVAPGGAAFDFCAVSATGRNTLVRFDANTGQILGEYRTAPVGHQRNPSRTAVDSAGNVWVGNRDEVSGGMGSVCRIGLVVGGTRVDASGTANPNGQFLAPPYLYNTCIDRDGDGLIRTSRGLNDVLDWPDVTDGAGGADGIVHDALDECIQIFQRTTGIVVRHVSVDANDDLWVGGYPDFPNPFNKLSGVNGAVLATFVPPGCGGHGGVVDPAGIIWSVSLDEDAVLRYDPVAGAGICIPVLAPHGLGIDSQGNIWIAQFDMNAVTKIAPNGTIFPGFPKRSGGASFDRSLAVTFADDNVWVGSSAGNDVSRLDNNGTIRKVINLGANGNSPRGVSVDGNGKVWVTNFGSNNAMRIDPNGAADHLGAVDMTVDLGTNATPYNFGDFTGRVDLGTIQPNGSWTVVFDAGAANTEFGRIGWNALVPANTSFAVSFRASNSLAGLDALPFVPAVNGQAFSGVFGRFVQIRADFMRANPSVTASPVLFDLTIEALEGPPPPPDCVPGQRNPASLLVYPEFDNRTGDMTLLSLTNVDGGDESVDVEFVYIGKYGPHEVELDCSEVNRTRRLTPNDTVSLLTRFDNPNQSQGYVYAFAKSRTTGQAIVHDHLIGQALVIDGIEALQYSFNAYSFTGVGPEGSATDRDGDGIRDLNTLEYQCTSDVTLVPRFLGQSDVIESDLVLINLTGGTQFDATLDLLVYNDNEEVFSDQVAFRCWDKLALSDISNVFDNDFLVTTANAPNESISGVETGWFRIDGNVANSPAASIPDPAFLALLVERVGSYGVADLPFETGSQTNGDLLPRGIFGDLTP